jgi:hypothetical protein
MPEKMSRRAFAKKAASVTAGMAVAPLLNAQEKATVTKDPDIDAIHKMLAQPLPDEARPIFKQYLAIQRAEGRGRLGLKITENSEPSFVYLPVPKATPDD